MNVGIRGRNFDEDVFHGHIAHRRRGGVKILLFHRASETFQLADDVFLRAANSLGPGRVRPDGHKLLDMLVRPGAVKATRRFRRGRGRKRCRLGSARSLRAISGGRGMPARGEARKAKRREKQRPSSQPAQSLASFIAPLDRPWPPASLYFAPRARRRRCPGNTAPPWAP